MADFYKYKVIYTDGTEKYIAVQLDHEIGTEAMYAEARAQAAALELPEGATIREFIFCRPLA